MFTGASVPQARDVESAGEVHIIDRSSAPARAVALSIAQPARATSRTTHTPARRAVSATPQRPAAATSAEVEAWWLLFRSKGPGWAGARAQLLSHFRPVLRAIAAREASRLPAAIDLEDLVSEGTIGLMKCLESFRPEAGVTFETFCSKRVRGAMVDYLRALDWHPRLTQRRHRKVERCREQFRLRFGREALPEEIERSLREQGLTPEEAQQTIGDCSIVPVRSLTPPANSDHDSEQLQLDAPGGDPARGALRADLKKFIGRNLSRCERLVLYLYYYEDMTMKEIGAVLGKSESRVSQMHSLVLDRLRSEWLDRDRSELTGE